MDLLNPCVRESTDILPSVKEVNSLPEIGKDQERKYSRPPCSSKSVPNLKMRANTSDTEENAQSRKSQHKEVMSNAESISPAYSDDFMDGSSIEETKIQDENPYTKTAEEEKELCKNVIDGIQDVKEAKKKLSGPQQEVLRSAIDTLEQLIKCLKEANFDSKESEENLEETGKDENPKSDLATFLADDGSVVALSYLKKSLQDRIAITDNLKEKLQKSNADLEERNELVEKLLNRLMVGKLILISHFLF